MSAKRSTFHRAYFQEVSTTARLVLPLLVGHVSVGLIALVDNVIAGHHATVTLAAVTLGTAILWLPMLVPIGTLIALTAQVAKLSGAGREAEIGAVFRQALWLALGMGGLMFLFLSLAPHWLEPAGIAAEVVPQTQAFLSAVRWGSPALSVFFCMRYLSEGMRWMRPTMVFGFGGLCVLAPLGYGLTHGKWGFPELGAQGLGIASATMMWLQAILFALYLWLTPRFAHLQLFECFEWPNLAQLRGLLSVGLPIGVAILMQGGLFIATSLLIGQLGAIPLAAHQIAVNVAQVCFMVPVAVAEATTVRVGHALGRGDRTGVRRATMAGYGIVCVTQLVSASLLLFAHVGIAQLYTGDAAVIALASSLLLYAALLQLPDGLQMLASGALRGLQDTRVPMMIAVFAYWGIGMPLGAWLGLGLGWGPQGMWVGLITALSMATVLMVWRFHSSPRMPVAAAPVAQSIL
ncbi:MATE family efflux transporter [Pseudomonas fluorescens]|uniref:MATE family efflux transporter n=1 Tax=Pseudomonas TaxID=286 RepID=UPI001908E592|nr:MULTISPECIES: MATE family efflux transporter [Pseudomonas]MBD8094125.1 MATE family efflux transporter [Pseudomonas fluorescens]MBD8721313.1 MATE family efflux transporter [Pseudomonas fluorescens]MDL2186996.1 MATE family efflux transporter [Pseudomonas sp. ChxA]